MRSMASTGRMVTADELLRMPDDGTRRELVRGALRQMSAAGHWHGRVAMAIGSRLAAYVREHDLGCVYAAETGFLLETDPDTVRAPDAAFAGRERALEQGTGTGFFRGAPDLAVEVLSPNDTFSAVAEKAIAWIAAGTRMVLVLDPQVQSATVFGADVAPRLIGPGKTLDLGAVVPGLLVAVDALFDS